MVEAQESGEYVQRITNSGGGGRPPIIKEPELRYAWSIKLYRLKIKMEIQIRFLENYRF